MMQHFFSIIAKCKGKCVVNGHQRQNLQDEFLFYFKREAGGARMMNLAEGKEFYWSCRHETGREVEEGRCVEWKFQAIP